MTLSCQVRLGHPPAQGGEGLAWFGSRAAGPYGPSPLYSIQAPQPRLLTSSALLEGPTDPGEMCVKSPRLALQKSLGVHPSSFAGDQFAFGQVKP